MIDQNLIDDQLALKKLSQVIIENDLFYTGQWLGAQCHAVNLCAIEQTEADFLDFERQVEFFRELVLGNRPDFLGREKIFQHDTGRGDEQKEKKQRINQSAKQNPAGRFSFFRSWAGLFLLAIFSVFFHWPVYCMKGFKSPQPLFVKEGSIEAPQLVKPRVSLLAVKATA